MLARGAGALRGSRCVVTGGFGFIGSNLVHALHAAGASVGVVDALIPSHGGDIRNVEGLDVESVVAEIGSPDTTRILRDADVVFNLAGQVSHSSSMRDPLADMRLNATSHTAFLEQMRTVNPAARIVHASTRQVYGRGICMPVNEDHVANPIDVNGVAKLAGEQMHMVYAHAHGMAITSLRLTNVYGPRQRLTSDQLGFLPVFIRRAMRGEQIQIFGDGRQRRDCLHVDDVVDALIAATADKAVGSVYNVGHPEDASLHEIARTIVDIAGTGSEITMTPWPDDAKRIDIGSFHTDGSRFRNAFQWAPVIGLPKGLADTVAFYREHPWYLSST